MKKKSRISRILMVSLAAILMLTMSFGCSKQDAGSAKTEKLTTDVVVVGAGASGISAAVAAADQGAKVIIIEKTAMLGGASNLSWAGKFINSSTALKNGVKVDEEKIINDWIVLNHWRVNAAQLRQYITTSGDTYDWLANHGYPTTFLNFFGEQMHMLPDYAIRQDLFKKMLANSVEKNGGQVLTETTGKSLLTNDKGEVVGVSSTKKDGTTLEITAKAVIIATGGYAGNDAMVKEASGFDNIQGGLSQNIGEGLEMAWAVGAEKPVNFGIQMFHQTLTPGTATLKTQYSNDKASYPLMLTYLPTFMNVSQSGDRFRDETSVYTPDAAANTSIYQGPVHYVIVSQSQIDAMTKEGMQGVKVDRLPAMPPEFYLDWADKFKLDNPWVDLQKVLDSLVENKNGFKGATLDELATNAGFDAATLKATFASYDNASKTGVDADFGKAAKYLVAYGEGPYYAIPAQINNLASCGGLNVNKSFQVLSTKKIPIKGLYAVGLEAEGVLFSDAYVGNGDGIGYAFTSGRLGGDYAAKDVLGK